jgi:hypothetical protein
MIAPYEFLQRMPPSDSPLFFSRKNLSQRSN